MKFFKVCLLLLSLTLLLSSCTSKQHTEGNIPPPFQEAVKAGRLSPKAARSLRGSAPQIDMMDAYVDRVEKARAKINRMNIPEVEKRRLIRIEMSKAGADWKHKLEGNRSQVSK